MSNNMFENLKAFLETDKGKESIKRFQEKLQREQDHEDRWVEKFKTRCENDLDLAIETLLKKYDSDEYVNKEYKLGYEPREKLLWLVWSYAKTYCKECEDDSYANMFTGSMYYIGSYVIQIMHGQGSALRIDKIKQNDTEQES